MRESLHCTWNYSEEVLKLSSLGSVLEQNTTEIYTATGNYSKILRTVFDSQCKRGITVVFSVAKI